MDFETAFDLLSNEYRRAIVDVLDETGPVSRQQLTTRLLARGVGPADASDRPTRRRLRIALHHNHLPRLADAGVLTYDDERVAPTSELDATVEWLEESGPDTPSTAIDLGDQLTEFYA
ncbi:DUF7344 domain-containing protein [Halorussus aquaticus]|uniref:DUF7344 domain-containing protein n=1 Tax=Halorussus aquaticus TaxID=2953748 RepID=A0ABD5Q3C4_9EURY|nr:hypothetical protein [Halorussus aquaticus]